MKADKTYCAPAFSVAALRRASRLCDNSWDSALGQVNFGTKPEENDGEGYF